ncbi:unnamed protein product [Closterium sp. NIES-54]
MYIISCPHTIQCTHACTHTDNKPNANRKVAPTSISAEGDCYVCVPPDPGIEAAALGASESAALGAGESALSGTASAQVLHTFTLDSGASRSFFRDRTTLTQLSRPVAVSLADPSGGPVLAHYSTVLPCPAAPSGSLSGIYLPSFSTNLVSGADLQDSGVDQFTPATSRSGPESAPCSCRLLSHQTLLWHHCLGHPSLPHLRGMASRVLVAGLPRSLPPLPLGPAPTCIPYVEGRQRAAPHSSEFPPTEAPLQTLHMDVWGPARVRGQGHERYFLLVVDDYSRYTTVSPLRSKGEVTEVSMPETSPTLQWTGKVGDASAFRVWGSRAFVRDLSADKLSSRAVPCVFLGFPPDAPGWQFYHPTSRRVLSSQDATFDESVLYYRLFPYRTAPLPPPAALPHARSPPDAVEPVKVAVDSGASGGAVPERAEPGGAGPGGAETEHAEPGGAGPGGAEPERAEPARAGSGGAEPGVAESGGAEPAGSGPGGPLGALSRRELPSPQELREWFARRWSRAAGAGGAAGASSSTAAGDAGATGPGGACTGAAGSGGTTGGAGAGRVAGVGANGGTGAGATASSGGPAGAGAVGGTRAGGAAGAGASKGAGVCTTGAAGGATGAGGAAGVGADAAGSGGAARPRPYFVPLLEQVLGLPPSSGPAPSLECAPPVQSESQLQLTSALPAPSPYAGPTGGLAERREPESRPASPVSTSRTSRRAPRPRPPAVPGTHQMTLRPSTAPQRVSLLSSLPALADPESDSLRAASPTVMRFLATVVTDPSFASTAASALVAELVDFAAHCRLDYAASLVAESESVCPPSVGGECALSMDVLEDRQEEFQCFAAALPHLVSMLLTPEGDLDAPDIPTSRSYAEAIEGPYSSQWQSAMDAEMASWKSTGTYIDEVPPPGANIVSGMWIFRVKRPPGSPPVFKARYVAQGFSQRQGVDYFQTFSPTPKMTTLRAPREWHDTLRTTLAAPGFAPSTADPSPFLRTDTLLPPFYVLVYVDDLVFATADTAGFAHVKSELQKRHTCTDLGELHSYLGLQITRDRARRTITLTQSHMVQQVLQRFDFTYSSPQATPLSTRHSLSALPSDESVEPSGPYPELVGCLMYLMTCTRPDLAYPLRIQARYVAPGRHRLEHMAAANRVLRYLCSTSGMGLVLGGRSPVVLTGHADASWVDDLATQRSSQGYTFSLGSGSVSWRSTRSSSVLSSSCEAEIYAGAMVVQELRWLTYLLTDLGEQPRSPPVLYVDNKAMLALCREHRLEHKTKHFALRYFLSRELQQCGQLRLAYVASQANTADIFTKALQPCDHQRFCTMLGLVPTWRHCAAATVLRSPALVGSWCPVFYWPYSSPTTGGLTERLEPASCPASPVRTGRRVPRPRTPPVPGTHAMALRPSSIPVCVPLHAPPESSLPSVPDPESDRARAASPTVSSLLATVVTDPSFESTATSALVAELYDFAAAYRLDYATTLVAESESASPPSVGGECALGMDVLEDRQEDFECLAAAVPCFASMLLAPEGDPDAPDVCGPLTPPRTGMHEVHTLGFEPETFALLTEPPQVAASAQVSASSQVAPPCSCCLLSHQTLLWHHHLGHPSLPCLRGMHSRLLVSGLPRSLPPLPPSPAPPCLPCVEGRQRAAPHSSSFPPMSAPLQTLHMDVWGPARVCRQGRERYFPLVVDDYTRYTTVFPLRSKAQVIDVFIPWIRAVRLQLRERFHQDLPVLRLHSCDLLRDLCRGEGILQSFTLPDSPQQNGIDERRIGLVMEEARTSMIHVAAPHFLWSFAGPAPSGVSQVDPLPGTMPFEVASDSGAARGDTSGGAESGGAEPGGSESEGAGSGGPEPGGAEPGGAEIVGVEPGGAEPEGVEPGGAESEGAESGGAEPRGTASTGGPASALPRQSPRPEPLSPQQLRKWFAQRTRLRSGAAEAADPTAGDTRAGGARVTARASGTRGAAAAGSGGARTRSRGAGARGPGAGGAGARVLV